MRVLRNFLVIASILGMIGALSACHRNRHEPMKLGSVTLEIQQVIPG